MTDVQEFAAEDKLGAALQKLRDAREAPEREMREQYADLPSLGAGDVEFGASRIPIIGIGFQVSEAREMVDIARRSQVQTLLPGEEEKLQAFVQQMYQDKTFGHTVLDLTADLPAMAVDWLASGGIVGGAKAGAKKALGHAVKDVVADKAKKSITRRMLEFGGDTAARTLAMEGMHTVASGGEGGRAALATYQNILGEIPVTADSQGQIQLMLDQHIELPGFWETMAKHGIQDALFETAGEKLGGTTAFSRVRALQLKIMERIVGKTGSVKTAAAYLEKIGYQGAIAEMLEERASGAMRAGSAALGVGDFGGMEEVFPGWEQLAAELVAFSVPGAVGNAVLSKPSQKPGAEPELEGDPIAAPSDEDVQASVDRALTDKRIVSPKRLDTEGQDWKRTAQHKIVDNQLSRTGQTAVWVEDEGDWRALHAGPGVVVLNSKRLPTQKDLAEVAVHEPVHDFEVRDPDGYAQMETDILAADAAGLEAAKQAYAKSIGEADWAAMTAAQQQSEGVATYTEWLAPYLLHLRTAQGKKSIETLLKKDRSLAQKVLDLLRDWGGRVVGMGTLEQRRLEALSKTLGGKAEIDAAQMATEIHKALEGFGARVEGVANAPRTLALTPKQKRAAAKARRSGDREAMQAQIEELEAQRGENVRTPASVLAEHGGINLALDQTAQASDVWSRVEGATAGQRGVGKRAWIKGPKSKSPHGLTLEQAQAILADAGFLPEDTGTGRETVSIDQLLDMVDAELAGEPMVHPESAGHREEIDHLIAELKREIEVSEQMDERAEVELAQAEEPTVHEGVLRWANGKAAAAWAVKYAWPSARVVKHSGGYSVQSGVGGQYAGPSMLPKKQAPAEEKVEPIDDSDWIPFSPAPEGGGKPLTPEQIEAEEEGESGTVADVEIDEGAWNKAQPDVRFSPAPKVGRIPLIDNADLKGKRKFVFFADRMRVGTYEGLHGDGIDIPLQGGAGYPFIQGQKGKAGWAFTDAGMFSRFAKRVDATDGLGIVTLFASGNVRGNLTFLRAYIAEAEAAIAGGRMSAGRFMREANKLRRSALASKMLQGVDSAWKPLWKSAWKTPAQMHEALAASTFEVRNSAFFGWSPDAVSGNRGSKIGRDELVGAGRHKGFGFPNISDMVYAMEEPKFAGLPYGAMVGAVQFDQGQAKSQSAGDLGIEEHLSYPHIIKGRGVGFLRDQRLVTDVIKSDKGHYPALRSASVKMAEVRFSPAPRVGSAAFDRWFSWDWVNDKPGSKPSAVVDEKGEPLLVFHYSRNPVLTAYRSWSHFGTAKAAEDRFGDAVRPNFRTRHPAHGGTYSAYLSIQNPLRLRDVGGWGRVGVILEELALKGLRVPGLGIQENRHAPVETSPHMMAKIEAHLAGLGYDGIVYQNQTEDEGADSYLVFRPEQIKSATGNRGTFDPANPDIRFSPKSSSKDFGGFDLIENFAAPEPGFFDFLRTGFLDKQRRLEVILQDLRAQGINVEEGDDTLLAARLWRGLAQDKVGELERVKKRFKNHLRKHGIEIDDMDAALWAQHYDEAIAVLAQREGAKANIGVDLKKLAHGRELLKRTEIMDAVKMIQTLNRNTRRAQLDYELISEEEFEAWEEMFDWYVPLRDGDNDQGFGAPRSKGFHTSKAPESKKRMGRGTEAGSPTILSFEAAHNVILRGEKNRVGQAFYRMVHEHGALGSVVMTPEADAYKDSKTWEKEEFRTKIKGVSHSIMIRDPHLAKSMKNLDVQEMGKILNGARKLNRVLGSMLTQYNPVFWPTNLARDLQAALVNVAEIGDGMGRSVLANIPMAIKQSWAFSRNGHEAEGADWAKRASRAGMHTGWSNVVDFAETSKDFAKDLRAGTVKDFGKGLADYVGDLNAAFEQSTRVAVFKAMVEKGGMSDAEAARYAREVTVDFNRAGEWTQTFNALYLFFNASVQGNARAIQAMFKNGRVFRRRVIPMVGFAVMMDQVMRAISPEDDDGRKVYDNIGEWEKENNAIFFMPGSEGTYFKMPLPYGYNVIHNLGRLVSSVVAGKADPGESSLRLALTGWNSFSPVQGGTVLQTAMPTAVRPYVEIAENKNFAGIPIGRTKYPGDVTPDSRMSKSTTPKLAKWIAEALNDFSGGNEAESGVFDVNPESLDHLWEAYTGGIGKIVSRSDKAFTSWMRGVPVETNTIPLYRRFVGESTHHGTRASFYDIKRDIQRKELFIKINTEKGSRKRAARYRRENRDLLRLGDRLKTAEKKLKGIREKRLAEEDQKKVRALEEQEHKIRARFVRLADQALKDR